MSTLPSPLSDVRVLLVEDDEDTRELYAYALREAGADVRAAGDVAAALHTVAEWTPTLVVSDLAMPATDGLSFLRELRAMPHMLRVPAIAVSGFSEQKDRNAALGAGFQEHLVKPLGPDELVATVARWAAESKRA